MSNHTDTGHGVTDFMPHFDQQPHPETRYKRLKRPEFHAQDNHPRPPEEQVKFLKRHSCEIRMRYVEADCPGELLNQDAFYWGTLKGVGKVYVQMIVDVFCSLAFAKVYTSKMPIASADLLNDRVLAVLRGPERAGKSRVDRQRSGVLWSPWQPSLRALPAVARHRASHHSRSKPSYQRLRRAHEWHVPRRILPGLRPNDVVYQSWREPA